MALAASEKVTERVGTLPSDTTTFLGRREELAEVRRLLSVSRLVTLVGVGGVGKTRLALRAAWNMRRALHDRVWFVELADLRNPVLLASTVADQVGVRDQSSRPRTDLIVEHLDGGAALLVLDNCERLIDECAELVTALLRALPELRVLTTSRQSLGLLGESMLPVDPLPLPELGAGSAESVLHNDCVRLFTERARAVAPQFTVSPDNYETLVRVCRRLDGIPLAIELTAVCLRAFSLEQVADRLADRFGLLSHGVRSAPPRQRTLRALMDWSYDLCPVREQKLWARASVFSGSFDLAALQHVAGADEPKGDFLGVVDSLVDKSILVREAATARYRMLETVREYGTGKLSPAETRSLRRRHRDWYAGVVARFVSEWIGPDQVAWITTLRQDHPNLRVALDHCFDEPGDVATGLRMATQLDDYWLLCGFHTEARHWLDQFLRAVPASAQERRAALRVNAWFATLQGDIGTAQALLAEAVELARAADDERENAYLLHLPGATAFFGGALDQAETLLHDALSGFRATGEARGELHTLVLLGQVVALNGERERGLGLLREAVEATARLGEVYFQSWSLWAIAQIETRHDALDRADRAARQALSLEEALANRFTMAFTLDTLGWIADRRGQYADAAELFGMTAALCGEIGISLDAVVPIGQAHHEHSEHARLALGQRSFDVAFERGFQQPTDRMAAALLSRRTTVTPAPRAASRSPLTRRETEIAALVTEGLTNKDIAARLVISQRTVEAHVEHVLTKLGFTSRTQIAAWMTGEAPGTEHPATSG